MNNENYEKNPRARLAALLSECGWIEVKRNLWGKENVRLLVDMLGVFLFQWVGAQWTRRYGLAHTSMRRIAHTREMVFAGDAKLNLENGVFVPAPTRKRGRR